MTRRLAVGLNTGHSDAVKAVICAFFLGKVHTYVKSLLVSSKAQLKPVRAICDGNISSPSYGMQNLFLQKHYWLFYMAVDIHAVTKKVFFCCCC